MTNKKFNEIWGSGIADHWRVDSSVNSFNLLLNHLKVKTNFLPFFEEAFTRLLENRKEDNLIILDLGGGVGWTSAVMAKNPRVKKVFLVEPSSTRTSINKYINKHFNVPDGKVEIINGTFQDFNMSTKVDIVVLCASIHHCHDQFIPKLFNNIESCLKDPFGKSRVLIANEHIVNNIWVIKRFCAYLKNRIFPNKQMTNRYYGLSNLRTPHPIDGEHWRTKKEIDEIFENAGYSNNFFKLNGDLCIKKPSFFRKIGWIYYYSFLDKDKS